MTPTLAPGPVALLVVALLLTSSIQRAVGAEWEAKSFKGEWETTSDAALMDAEVAAGATILRDADGGYIRATHRQYPNACGPGALAMMLARLGVPGPERVLMPVDVDLTPGSPGPTVDVGPVGSMEHIMWLGYHRHRLVDGKREWNADEPRFMSPEGILNTAPTEHSIKRLGPNGELDGFDFAEAGRIPSWLWRGKAVGTRGDSNGWEGLPGIMNYIVAGAWGVGARDARPLTAFSRTDDEVRAFRRIIKGFIDHGLPVLLGIEAGGHFNVIIGYRGDTEDVAAPYHIYAADPLDGWGRPDDRRPGAWRRMNATKDSLFNGSKLIYQYVCWNQHLNGGCDPGGWALQVDARNGNEWLCGRPVPADDPLGDPMAASTPRIVRVRATQTTLEITAAGPLTQRLLLVELHPFEAYDASVPTRVVWEGKLGAKAISIPRLDGKRDRLYSKLQLVDAEAREALGPAHYVDDLSALPRRDFDLPWPKGIKGLQVQELDDAIALGVKHAGINIMLSSLLVFSGGEAEETWEVDGEEIGINAGYVRHLDARFKRLTDAGMSVTAIILNGVPTRPDPGNPLIHPKTDLAGAPFHLGAINTTDARGLRYYRAGMEYLANRYSDPSGEHGFVSGYIIGNEVQAHWEWYNIGRTSLEDFVPDYGIALRVADLAARRFHSGIRTYVSMEHHWGHAIRPDPLTAFRGKEFLEQLGAWAKTEGDFPWQVAFHPYPENLFEPRTWLDKQALLSFDSPKITFKNIEVLPIFLRQERFLFRGSPRHVILSEQGFHTPDGPQGEDIQAAAYAYTFYKLSHTPGIEAFILHRHVDYKTEGGLRLGLWTWKEDDPAQSKPDRKKRIYEVFRLADTEQWEEAFEFAKPIIGIEEWEEILPAQSSDIDTGAEPGEVAYDLYLNSDRAKRSNCMDWRAATLQHEGRTLLTLFHHPQAQGDGDATYDVSLPAPAQGGKLILRFATGFSGPTEDGVRFAVLVDDTELWGAAQTDLAPVDREVDLSAWMGKTIRLTLRVNAIGNAQHDWANWVRPRVFIEGP